MIPWISAAKSMKIVNCLPTVNCLIYACPFIWDVREHDAEFESLFVRH